MRGCPWLPSQDRVHIPQERMHWTSGVTRAGRGGGGSGMEGTTMFNVRRSTFNMVDRMGRVFKPNILIWEFICAILM